MSDQIRIGEIDYILQNKRVRNLSIRVIPPDGIVKVTVPFGMKDADVRKFLQSKQNWIRKHQDRIAQRDFDKMLQFVSGEVHYLFGNKYPLLLKEGAKKQGIHFSSGTINLHCKDGAGRQEREKIMDEWYRDNLMNNLPALFDKWENRMNLRVNEFRVRKMTTRWGSCNPLKKRIWISLMLAKRRPALVEYIVVHEMAHLIERGHNKRFYALMDKYLPGWKDLRKELK